MTALEQAKKERSLWDCLRKDNPGKTMSEVLSKRSGGSETEIRQRSNLLKLGLKVPGVHDLWDQVDHKELPLTEAYRQAKALKKGKPMPIKPKRQTKPKKKGGLCKPTSIKPKRQTKPEPTPGVQEILGLLKEASNRLQVLDVQPDTQLKNIPMTLPDQEVRGVILRVRDMIYAELEKVTYLNADKNGLAHATRVFLVDLDEGLKTLGEDFTRLRDTEPPKVGQSEVTWALKVLGFDPLTPKTDRDQVKRAFRREARIEHPDRTRGGRESPRMVELTRAWDVIHRAWY